MNYLFCSAAVTLFWHVINHLIISLNDFVIKFPYVLMHATASFVILIKAKTMYAKLLYVRIFYIPNIVILYRVFQSVDCDP